MYRTSYAKYGNKRTEFEGRYYDSKLEASVARELSLRLKAGEFTEIVPQFRIKLYVYLPDGEKAHVFDYICDFRCTKADGSYLLCEAKGKVTDLYRVKRKILDLVWLPDHLEYEFEERRRADTRV